MKTLVFIKTHFINKFILNELKKLRKCSSEDFKVVLFIDNHTGFLDTDKNGKHCISFRGIKEQECFVFDEEIFEKMKFPYWVKNEETQDMSKIMWWCCDYPFYIMQKYYPDYDYYWQIESDVFCNGNSYKPFFDKFESCDSDLIAQGYCEIPESDVDWGCKTPFDWIYYGKLKYVCWFPVVRLSQKANKFLYAQRMSQKKIYNERERDEINTWTYCENFVSTELSLNKFKCESLKEENIKIARKLKINEDIPVRDKNNCLYHPVKTKQHRTKQPLIISIKQI